MEEVKQVIIAGGGPVGLFLACELALAKVSVLVLERSGDVSSPLKRLPFGIRGLSAPSIEALDRRGLLSELGIHKRIKSPHRNSGEGSQRQVGHFAGIPLLDGLVDRSRWNRLPSSTPTSLISEIEELETIFTRRALALSVEIRRGLGVTSVEQTRDHVVVRAGDESFECEWLVGCDGARSAVRKSGGFEFAGTEPEFTGYTLLADIDGGEKLSSGRQLTERGLYMQSQPGYIVIQDFDKGAFHNSGDPLTLEHLQSVLRRVSDTDVTLKKVHAATTWTDRARQATEYRRDHVLLAGDAAHIHSPLGGQGLNLGLGDAMNLGWKLAAVTQSRADTALLDTYFNERHPIGVDVLNWSRAQVDVMMPSPGARALHAIFRDLINTEDGATYIASRVWGVNMHYDLGSAHPLVGSSAPNFEFADGTKLNDHMHDGRPHVFDLQSLRARDSLGLRSLSVRPDGIVESVD